MKQHRAALIVLVAATALGCLALGWWQWSRFESAGGTTQNLGYALQWPLFAGFVVYAYRRFIQLESAGPAPAPPPAQPREIPDGLLPARPTATPNTDEAMRAYNSYLAGLATHDRQTEADRNTP